MKEKACRKCGRLTMDSSCPNDGSKDFGEQWSGLVIVLDPGQSSVAETMGVKNAGRYALKVL